jgi:site-specific DNA-methyltransferase (adenine-specific)
LADEWTRAGLRFEQANEACGTASMAAGHFFSVSQWRLPTEAHYNSLRAYVNSHNHGGEYLRREYEDLRREYEDLRREYEDLRRYFSVTPDVPYTDVWNFSTVSAYPGKHPCEKPQAMMEHIVRTSSRPGDVVLDCFVGSGSTGKAAARLGRSFIGIDNDAKWIKRAHHGIEQMRLRLGQIGMPEMGLRQGVAVTAG